MSSRAKILIAAGIGVAVVVAWFFLYYSPKGDDLSAIDEDLDQAMVEESELETQLALLQRLEEEAPAREAALRRLNAAVPVQPDLDVFIVEANEIADLAGVDWLSVSPTPPAAGAAAGVSVISMSIEIEGGFFQVLDYINRLEDVERLVIVDSLSISTGGGADGGEGEQVTDSGSGAPTLSVTLAARMYTRADAALGDAADPGSDTPSTDEPSTDEPAPDEPTPDEPRPDTVSPGDEPATDPDPAV